MKRIFGLASGLALAIVMLIGSASTAQAQWVLLPDTTHKMVQQGMDYMYNLEYQKADEIFNQVVRSEPGHPAGYFLLALTDWWRIKPNINDKNAVAKYSESFNQRIDRTIEICNQRLDTNEFDIVGLFFKGAAYGYRARLKATADPNVNSITDWVSILRDANEGRKALLECQRLAPSNSDILLGSGLFNYYADVLPQKYSILKKVSLPPGDKEIGLQMLQISSAKALYTGVEADYSLIEIYTNFENNYRAALPISEKLNNKFPDNPDFQKYYGRDLYYTGNYTKAEEVFMNLMSKVKARKNGYELSFAQQSLYYLGDIQLRIKNNPGAAVKIFEQGIEVHKRLNDTKSGYYVAMNLKLGNAYDKLGKRKEAIAQYKKVLELDDVNNKYHPKAEQYINTPYS